MKHKKLVGLAIAGALVLSLTTTALAASTGSGGNLPPTEHERAANGDTTISIMQAKVDPKNVSFTVPLYVTMAVVEQDDVVKVPDNYGITNTTPPGANGAGDDQYLNIGVTAMSFEKLHGSTYETVADPGGTNPVVGNTSIFLTIGGMTMPPITNTEVTTADAGVLKPVTIGGVLGTAATPTKIGRNQTLNLPLVGKVAKAARSEDEAVAQFKVKYTISLLDSTDKPLGWVYSGDDRTQAGLEPFVYTPPA